MKLTVQVTRGDDAAYRARCPALPGCVVYASSRGEVLRKMQRAVDGYVASIDVALPRELKRHFLADSVAAAL